MTAAVWPLLVYAALVAAVIGVMLALSAVLGERHRERATGEPYEAGVVGATAGVDRSAVRFWRIALLFVVFDLEVMFLIAWAVGAREAGWTGYLGMLVFLAILAVALVYEWRSGGLDVAGAMRRFGGSRQ
jgi:NADH-quinone oxidoreductase subunit A